MRLFRLFAALMVCATAATAQDRPRIVVVNQALGYFAERLLGDTAEVVFPVPEGVDPSFWRPAIADISMIQGADLIVLNGAGFATWIDRVSLPRSKVVNTTAAIVDQFIVTESITHSHGDGGEHSHEGLAAYTWLDPDLAAAQTKALAGIITARGLAEDATVTEQLTALQSDLVALNEAAATALLSAANTHIIATHPRYQYFARAYGLTMTSLQWEAGAMPTDDQLAELDALVTETGARILIWEATPPAPAIAAAEALNLQSVVFPPLAGQSDDTDYLAVFTRAVTAIAAAVPGD